MDLAQISTTYRDRSFTASKMITKAFTALSDRLSRNATTGLKTEFGLCYDPTPGSSDEAKKLNTVLTAPYMAAVEFNYAKGQHGRGPGLAYPFEQFINATLSSADADNPLKPIANAMKLWFGAFGADAPPCIDWNNTATVARYIASGIQSIPFRYITCMPPCILHTQLQAHLDTLHATRTH